NFWKTSRKTQIPVEKNRNLYVFWGFLLCIFLGIFDLIPRLPAGSIIGNILFCSVTTFAIIKYQLLDIHVVFRRGISYLLMSSAIAIPYVFLMYLVMDVWRITIPLPVLIISLIVLAGLLHPLWSSVQTLVNKSYYRKKYDYLLELRIFAAETHDISDIKTLTDTTIKLLDHVFQTEGIYILTPSVRDNYEILGYSNKKPINLFITKDNAIIKLMLNNNKIFSISSLNTQYSLPTDEVLKQFDELHIELIVPLKSLKNNLAGIILMGGKLSGQPYIQAEEKLIFAISKRIAPEFENAHLYNLELAMRQELEKQARLKSEFLHSVAHELKTPLTAIISSSESIIEFSSARLDKKEKKLLKNISTNAWSLDKRVTELLDFARYETTTASLNFQSFKLESLLRKAVSKYSYQFKKKEQILDVNISKSLPTIMGDIDKLQQVMFNLVSNANKLSPENSHIYLSIYLRDSKIFIEIEDSAPTIKDTGKIFDPYSVSEKTGSMSGLGLELASAKSLIELHKGEIHVENKQPIGNTFVVSLPIEIK
ncbi:MAG: ATP-binding protein, partial [Chloroflexi bacterium]|nr:ATP-binding protein [Chloroflexota bacterium]